MKLEKALRLVVGKLASKSLKDVAILRERATAAGTREGKSLSGASIGLCQM